MNFKIILYGILITGFISCSGYTKKDGKIYLRSSNEARIGIEYAEVKNADFETFKEINQDLNINLAIDKNHVFIGTSILYQADPKTFKQVKAYFWKDKNNVYLLQFGNTDARIIGADPTTFKVYKDNLWSSDKNNIYYMFDKLEKTDPSKFVVINESWGKDNQFYYFTHLRLDSIDYKTAKIVNTNFMKETSKPSEYIKDINHVYFQNKLVKDANPLTFVADGTGSFGHDDKYMFTMETNEGPITNQYRETYSNKK